MTVVVSGTTASPCRRQALPTMRESPVGALTDAEGEEKDRTAFVWRRCRTSRAIEGPSTTGAGSRRGSMLYRNSSLRLTGSTFISFMFAPDAKLRCHCSSRTVGRARSSSRSSYRPADQSHGAWREPDGCLPSRDPVIAFASRAYRRS